MSLRLPIPDFLNDKRPPISYHLRMTSEPTTLRAVIRVLWDSDSSVWIATSDDVPGLVVEAQSFDDVVKEVRLLAPELFDLNGISTGKVLDLHFLADRLESVAA